MRVLAAVVLLSVASLPAFAARRCNVDLEPMLSVDFGLGIREPVTGNPRSIDGHLVISKGGAATLMRTDEKCCQEPPRPVRVLFSWQLEEAELRVLRRTLSRAVTQAPAEECGIDDFEVPGHGATMNGSSYVTVHTGVPSMRFRIRHASPSEAPLVGCQPWVIALSEILFAIENTSGRTVQRLECLPYGAGAP